MSQSFLSRVERGQAGLGEENLHKIAGALAVSVHKLYEPNESNVTDAPPDSRSFPVLDYVQAGKWMTVQETPGDGDIPETLPTNLEAPPSSFFLRIRGNSMEPEFREGDVVLIAPPVPPHPGDYVVATDENGDATFKKYREVGLDLEGRPIRELVALNADYAPMRSDRQQFAIVGTMIEHRRYRRHWHLQK